MTAISKVAINDIQFQPGQDQSDKLRRLVDEIKKLQQGLNAVISEMNLPVISGAAFSSFTSDPAIGDWQITVLSGSPPTLAIRYNDGGTIRTGSITLS